MAWSNRRTKLALALSGTMVVLAIALWPRAEPSIESATIVLAPVKRGSLDISVSGQGELQSSDLYALSAPFEGTVQRVHVLPGIRLEKGQKIITINSNEIDRQLLDAKAALATEESRHAATVYDLNGRQLEQDDDLSQQRATVATNQLELDAMETLLPSHSISKLQYERQRLVTQASEARLHAMEESSGKFRSLLRHSLHASNEVLSQRREMLARLQERATGMEVRAESGGVLLELADGIREGKTVQSGQVVAEIARSDRLEAVVRVPASRAGDVTAGTKARVSGNRGTGDGHVVRIDPEATAAQVIVTVEMDNNTVSEFRPGLPVSVEFLVGREDSILYVSKPSNARPEGRGILFVREGDMLIRREVQYGRATTDLIAVLSGLSEGEEVAVSGTERFADARRLHMRDSSSGAALTQ